GPEDPEDRDRDQQLDQGEAVAATAGGGLAGVHGSYLDRSRDRGPAQAARFKWMHERQITPPYSPEPPGGAPPGRSAPDRAPDLQHREDHREDDEGHDHGDRDDQDRLEQRRHPLRRDVDLLVVGI